MEVNSKRKRSALSEEDTSTELYKQANTADFEYLDSSSSEDEMYAPEMPMMVPMRPEPDDLLLSSYELGLQSLQGMPGNMGGGNNNGGHNEIMTNVSPVGVPDNEYSNVRRKWTPEMDERLREGYNIFGKQWAKVAEFVGYNLHREQCRKRWSMSANADLQNRRKGDWTDEEMLRLRILADSHEHRSRSSRKKDSVNWTAISRELNRDYKECADKYKSLMSSNMIKGPYTREEDAFIMRRVAEWGNKGQGLWITMQDEMNRRSDSINKRWQRLSRSPETIQYADHPKDGGNGSSNGLMY